jgi:hypothetical protein
MVQDWLTTSYEMPGTAPFEVVSLDGSSFGGFRNGPKCDRVEVVLDKGQPTPFRSQKGTYDYSTPVDWKKQEPPQDFINVSVFGTVLQTIQLLEDENGLGRPLQWLHGNVLIPFNSQPLKIEPCVKPPPTDRSLSACFQGNIQSLRFSWIQPDANGPRIFSSLSRDTVAHETGHAAQHAVLPELEKGTGPEAKALGEAISDLTAMIVALHSKQLLKHVLAEGQGIIDRSNIISRIAEWVSIDVDDLKKAMGALPSGTMSGTRGISRYLRDSFSGKSADGGRDLEAHAYGLRLTAALYKVLVDLHEFHKRDPMLLRKEGDFQNGLSCDFAALVLARTHFTQMMVRALDYLPPGSDSFCDYGRAVVVADAVSYPKSDVGRTAVIQRFAASKFPLTEGPKNSSAWPRRLNAAQASAGRWPSTDLHQVANSDREAQKFVQKNAMLFCQPSGARHPAVEILPRVVTKKRLHDRGKGRMVQELIFKVQWRAAVPAQGAAGGPGPVIRGTTVVFDLQRPEGMISALLSFVKDEGPIEIGARAEAGLVNPLAAPGVSQESTTASRPDLVGWLRDAIRKPPVSAARLVSEISYQQWGPGPSASPRRCFRPGT